MAFEALPPMLSSLYTAIFDKHIRTITTVTSALIYVSRYLRADEKPDLALCSEILVRRNRILYHIAQKQNPPDVDVEVDAASRSTPHLTQHSQIGESDDPEDRLDIRTAFTGSSSAEDSVHNCEADREDGCPRRPLACFGPIKRRPIHKITIRQTWCFQCSLVDTYPITVPGSYYYTRTRADTRSTSPLSIWYERLFYGTFFLPST